MISTWITEITRAIRVARIKSKICNHFGEHCSIAIAVASAESGLRTDAKGWNCQYGTVSKACAKEDRGRAWSVDCGLFQINIRGQECPPETFDEDWNIEKAYKGKFVPSGWWPWSVCKNRTVSCGI